MVVAFEVPEYDLPLPYAEPELLTVPELELPEELEVEPGFEPPQSELVAVQPNPQLFLHAEPVPPAARLLHPAQVL